MLHTRDRHARSGASYNRLCCITITIARNTMNGKLKPIAKVSTCLKASAITSTLTREAGKQTPQATAISSLSLSVCLCGLCRFVHITTATTITRTRRRAVYGGFMELHDVCTCLLMHMTQFTTKIDVSNAAVATNQPITMEYEKSEHTPPA